MDNYYPGGRVTLSPDQHRLVAEALRIAAAVEGRHLPALLGSTADQLGVPLALVAGGAGPPPAPPVADPARHVLLRVEAAAGQEDGIWMHMWLFQPM